MSWGGSAIGRQVQVLATSTGRELMPLIDLSSCRPPHQSGDPDQQASPDEASNEVAEPSGQGDPEVAQNEAGDCRPDDAEHDIHQQPHVALHELLCQPACNSANYDRCDPAYRWICHGT